MEINQVLVSASPGDAVTNHSLALREVLRKVGPSEIFAKNIDPRLDDDVLRLDRYADRPRSRPATDVVIYHASIGEPSVARFLLDRPERLVLMYHNITPAEHMLPFDPAFAGLLAAGREELVELRSKTVLALTPSQHNAEELHALGFPRVGITPLIIDIPALAAVEPDESTMHHCREAIDGPIVLYVGQLLPHKRPDLLLAAYHVLVTYLVPEAHLVMVGPQRLTRYRDSLQTYLQEMNLNKAWLTGPVADEQLVAFYRSASVFVTASEHEGFCVPPLEAMAFDVPVVARRYAAIPETVGRAGLLLPAGSGPTLLAEALAEVMADGELRRSLVAAGRRRVGDFDPEVSRATFLSELSVAL